MFRLFRFRADTSSSLYPWQRVQTQCLRCERAPRKIAFFDAQRLAGTCHLAVCCIRRNHVWHPALRTKTVYLAVVRHAVHFLLTFASGQIIANKDVSICTTDGPSALVFVGNRGEWNRDPLDENGGRFTSRGGCIVAAANAPARKHNY